MLFPSFMNVSIHKMLDAPYLSPCELLDHSSGLWLLQAETLRIAIRPLPRSIGLNDYTLAISSRQVLHEQVTLRVTYLYR